MTEQERDLEDHVHPQQEDRDDKTYLSPHRLESLIDGVFAIAMTLLVLDLKVSAIGTGAATTAAIDLLPRLAAVEPMLITFFLSFIVLGVYWVGQHNIFHYVKYVDRAMLWINILFLSVVSFLPFSTSLIGAFPHQQAAILIYGANVIVIGIFSYLSWCYATVHHRLTEHSISPLLVKLIKRRLAFAPIIALIAMTLSFVSTTVSLVLYAFVPLYYIFPSSVDQFWSREAVPHSH